MRTWVEVSREALLGNVALLRAGLGAETTFCAVLKANAYGHDLATVAKVVLEAGQRHFAVDSIDEGLALRRITNDGEIIVLGYVLPERLRDAVAAQLIVTVYDEAALLALRDAAVSLQAVARVNIEIETGLYRLGVAPRQLNDLLRVIAANDRSLQLAGMMTHLATAEDVSAQAYVDTQAGVFAEAVATAAAFHLHPPYLHIACSAAVIIRSDVHFSMVRSGIAMYGLWPDQELRLAVQRGRAFELRPALAWKTRIAQVKDLPNGATVGYGRSFIANRPMRLAVLPVGYWDGYDRGLSGKGKVLVKGYLCPVVGRVCMNMTMVDVSAVPNAKAGDVVTLIGKEGMHTVAADDLAAILGTIHYEVVTRINPLIPRIVV